MQTEPDARLITDPGRHKGSGPSRRLAIWLELSGWMTVIFEPFVCAAASIDTHMLFATRASSSDGVGSPPLMLNQRENVSTVPDAFLIAVNAACSDTARHVTVPVISVIAASLAS